MLFRDGCINFNVSLLKIENLSEFLIFLYKLFHLITLGEMYEFLNKCMCNIDLKNIADVPCSACTPKGGYIIE